MAIKTPANLTPPPNSVEPQGDGVKLYRILERHVVDDGTGEVNLADAICKLNDPVSGEALNVNLLTDVTGPAPILNFRKATAEGRKVLFEQNFDTGFDTVNNSNCIFDGALLVESRNASASTAAGSVSAQISDSVLALQAVSSLIARDVVIIESKNYIKISPAGTTYLEYQGVFKDIVADPLLTDMFLWPVGSPPVQQGGWNVDTFDGSGDSNNPSEILLDFRKLQTMVVQLSSKYSADVKIGFLIDDTLYFAHVFSTNNVKDFTSTLNLPIREDFSVAVDTIQRDVGFFNENTGYHLTSLLDVAALPGFVSNQYTKSIVCYTVGADPVVKKIPFTVGNKATYVNVTAADTPLFSLQCAPTFKGEINRTVFDFNKLTINTSSQDANFGCCIKVFYNTVLGGVPDNFLTIPNNAESALLADFDATTITGGIEIFSTQVMANKTVEFSADDVFEHYRNEFSRAEIIGINIPVEILEQTLTVVASPMVGVIPTTSIDVSANISGGEVG